MSVKYTKISIPITVKCGYWQPREWSSWRTMREDHHKEGLKGRRQHLLRMCGEPSPPSVCNCSQGREQTASFSLAPLFMAPTMMSPKTRLGFFPASSHT